MSSSGCSPVECICAESENHAHELDKVADLRPSEATPEILSRLARAVALQSRMIVPLYRSYYNGGLPAKKAGKSLTIQTPIGRFSLHGSTAATWLFRALILWMLARGAVSTDAIRSAIRSALVDEINTEAVK